MPVPPTQPSQVCEAILAEEKRYNIEHDILPSENAIIDRLAAHRDELAKAYGDLHRRLDHHPGALRTFLRLVLSAAAFWNPNEIQDARSARRRLTSINEMIAVRAAELSELLQERSHLHNTSGFSTRTHYHVCEVIEAAASNNGLFRSYVREELVALRARFGLKYWPTLDDLLQEMSLDAGRAIPEASDPLTAAATEGVRASLTDFFKTLFAAMEENSGNGPPYLPSGFRPSDETLASLVNCSLDLGVEELVDGPYVKRLRQRMREESE